MTGTGAPRTGPAGAASASPNVRMGTATGRWIVAAAVLGSGVAFLDSTVVNAALPAIGRDLNADLADLQWVLTAYLLTLGSLLVLGGSLGDRFGRKRMFMYGLIGFAAASAACGAAPSIGILIAARARSKGSRRRCSSPGASRSSRRRSTPTTAGARSARGRGWAAWPPRPVRSSAGT